MKSRVWMVMSVLLMAVAGCKPASSSELQAAKHSSSETMKRSVQEHLDKTEKAIAKIVSAMSKGEVEKAEPTEAARRDVRRLSAEEAEAELIRQREAAIERSLANIAKALESQKDKDGVGSNCHWKQVCTYWYCTKWGSTGDGGTAKCLEYACGASEWKFVCD